MANDTLSCSDDDGFSEDLPEVVAGRCQMIYEGLKECKGDIVQKRYKKFSLWLTSLVVGGTQKQYEIVTDGFYCKTCGHRLEFVPEFMKLKGLEPDSKYLYKPESEGARRLKEVWDKLDKAKPLNENSGE